MFVELLILRILYILSSAQSIDIHWVLAQIGETQSTACARNNYDPLNSDLHVINWNETVLNDVVGNVLQLNVSTGGSNSYGLVGCCAPGLWCKNGLCFTQGFGQFSNFGWLQSDSTAVPVYTCTGVKTTTSVISTAVLKSGTLSVTGDAIALTNDYTSAFVYGESCGSVETCNCMACNVRSTTAQCPPNYVCLQSGAFQYCVVLCTNYDDLSCPCDQTCLPLAGSGTGTISICRPPDMDAYTRSCRVHTGNLQCNAARAYQTQYVAASSASSSYAVSLVTEDWSAQATVTPASTKESLSAGFCTDDIDCADGSIATLDTCDKATKLCVYTAVSGVSSVLPSIAGRQSPYMYHNFYSDSPALAQRQTTSAAYLLQEGTLSSTSAVDDYPMQVLSLSFPMVYFGNLVNTVYISPNGALALPPLRPCVKGNVRTFFGTC